MSMINPYCGRVFCITKGAHDHPPCPYCLRGDHHLCSGSRCVCKHDSRDMFESNMRYHACAVCGESLGAADRAEVAAGIIHAECIGDREIA